MKITTSDVQQAISYLIKHINADTGEQIIAVMSKMSAFLEHLYVGLSGMSHSQVRSLRENQYCTQESYVLISTIASSLRDKSRLDRVPSIQSIAATKSRDLKMPTIEGLIEASQFIIDNVKMAGDMLVELNKLFQAFSDAKTYASQDNTGTRALLTGKELDVLQALLPQQEEDTPRKKPVSYKATHGGVKEFKDQRAKKHQPQQDSK